VDDRGEDRPYAFALERNLVGEELIKHDAEGPYIGSGVDLTGVFDLLGRHIGGRAECIASSGEAGRGRDLGDSEIEDLEGRQVIRAPREE